LSFEFFVVFLFESFAEAVGFAECGYDYFDVFIYFVEVVKDGVAVELLIADCVDVHCDQDTEDVCSNENY